MNKADQSPRLPRAVLTPTLHHGRQDLSHPEASTSADHQSKRTAKYEETRRTHFEEIRRAKYEETRSCNFDYRIQGIPQSKVEGVDHQHG